MAIVDLDELADGIGDAEDLLRRPLLVLPVALKHQSKTLTSPRTIRTSSHPADGLMYRRVYSRRATTTAAIEPSRMLMTGTPGRAASTSGGGESAISWLYCGFSSAVLRPTARVQLEDHRQRCVSPAMYCSSLKQRRRASASSNVRAGFEVDRERRRRWAQ